MDGGGKIGNGGPPSCDIWELGNWSSTTSLPPTAAAVSTSYAVPHYSSSSSSCSPFADQALLVPAAAAAGDHRDHRCYSHYQPHQQQGQSRHHHHLTCLKLGKRHYFGGGEEGVGVGAGAAVKRERPAGPAAPGGLPRCQVEGCNKALVDAKDYHKRHKVCEMHSKAPKVVVLGAEQRFCQQCSRFHLISEFDDSKRSCRRRLAGHNERRRKSNTDSRNPSLESTLMGRGFPHSPNSPGRALSLLSSKASPWVSTSDISARSTAALHELMAENRATLLARQLFSGQGDCSVSTERVAALSFVPQQPQHQVPSQAPPQLTVGWNHFQEAAGTQVTLDLMQMPSSSFEILSVRGKSKEEEEECCEIWKSLEGTHVV